MRKIGIVIATFFIGVSGFAQEIDDMYFNSSDRKKARKEAKKRQSAVEFQSPDNYQFSDESFEAPETIEEYQDEAEQKMLQYQSPYNSKNVFSNYDKKTDEKPLDFNYQQEAYDQGYEDGLSAAQSPIINNYYGNNVRQGWNGGMGFNSFYDPWFGWGNSWSLSLGWGAGWGGNWGFYDPWFYDPFYGWNRPYASGWGWNRPWNNGWNRGWGWYCPTPLYDYGGYYIANNTPSKEIRSTQRGPRAGMGSTASTGVRSSSRGTTSVANDDRGTYSARSRNSYSSRTNGSDSSRPRLSQTDGSTSNRTYTRRTGETQSYQRRVPSQTSRTAVTPRTNRNYGNVQQGSTGSSNRNYSRPSTNSNRGVNSNLNRSNNSNTNRRSYTPSSSGSSSRSSATRSSSPSRSSSTRSSSSGSSRSSGSKSSSSSRSSSKRGN